SANLDKFYILGVHIRMEGSTILVIFTPENPEMPPYLIDNKSKNFVVKYNQKGYNVKEILQPKSSKPFAWDFPSKTATIQLEIGDQQMDYTFEEMRKYSAFS